MYLHMGYNIFLVFIYIYSYIHNNLTKVGISIYNSR